MRDSSARQARILRAAAALFVDHGYEATTLQKVSEKSGAAMGSITHFFTDKGGLALRVYEDVMRELAADARAALSGHSIDVEAAVRALIAACLGWDKKFPNHRRLIRLLEPGLEQPNRGQAVERLHELREVLAKWAAQLPSKHKVASLSADQLYAVMLAPAMQTGTDTGGAQSEGMSTSIDWLAVLTRAALCALAPPKHKARSPTGGTREGKTAHPDLYDPNLVERKVRS